MALPNIDGYTYYISNNDSDDDGHDKSSSEEEMLDEVDVFLYGTPKQKRKALKDLTGDEASSSDEDFENIMKAELEGKIKALEDKWKSLPRPEASVGHTLSQATTSDAVTRSTSKPVYYDDIYFDSDEEDNSKKQRLTDDELLYDPKADDEDQKWVDKQRKRRAKKVKKGKCASDEIDIVLTCPACMTILCRDCQKHSLYPNQFRAMFVLNCTVKFDEALHYKEKSKRQFRRHKRREQLSRENMVAVTDAENEGSASKSTYHPVKCTVCQTEVAVYDEDEVYHFFNVLAGSA